MISIRKYLEATSKPEAGASAASANPSAATGDLATVLLAAYRSMLEEMGRSVTDACPATGLELARQLAEVDDKLESSPEGAAVAESQAVARGNLQDWGLRTARHLQQKAAEVKDMLLAMASTAESVGDRDLRCALQIDNITTQLRSIASLDDISQIRLSIEKSASELKSSVDRLNAEGKAVLDALQAKVVTFQARLEEAEQIASLDALTRLHSRLWMEGQLEKRIGTRAGFCVAILDIDGFKSVNDSRGHVIGDDLLRQFANELRSACRSSDIVGRWGGDEFLVVLDCRLTDAEAQIERVRKWVCGKYTLQGASGPLRIDVSASIGLAEFISPETLEQLLHRADSAMYHEKSAARVGASASLVGGRHRFA